MKFVSCLLLAIALLGTSSLALADHDHGHRDHDRRGQSRAQRDHYQDRRPVQQRQTHYRRHDGYRYSDRRHGNQGDYRRYGYRPVHPHYRHTRWLPGHRYYGPTYVVRNYGYYRLRPPPRGYRWVRADNDFLLVAISTGIILDLALR